jgi:Peptidase family S51
MTKLILHGGFTMGEKQENDAFFKEILKAAPRRVKILLVYFAKEPDRIAKNKAEDIEQFNKSKKDKDLVFEVAEPKLFPEQANRADIIYLHGGHSGLLYDALQKIPNLEELLRGKTVAGDSAGANVLCEAFYSMKIGAHVGFGLIPIKIITHFKKENQHELDHMYPQLETLFLPEYEFKVYTE